MDPNATLAEIRQLTALAFEADGLELHDALRLAELASAMDDWLSHGGFLPSAWQSNR